MKIKISVIFFILCFILFITYEKFDISNIDILYIGDDSIYYEIGNLNHGYKLNKYTYDSITYNEIENDIRINSNKIVKEKPLYLNQMISSSDVIIISANNFKYNEKCKKIDRIIEDYDKIVNNEINSLVKLISKISNSDIYIIGNHCKNKEYEQKIINDKIIYVDYKNISKIKNIIKK